MSAKKYEYKPKDAKTRKRGALSEDDKEFIRAHAATVPISEIASALNRNAAPVKRFIKENYLVSAGMPTEDQERMLILDQLHSKPLWKECKLQFTEDELDYFESTWVDMMKQLSGDVLASEQLQLKKFITYEILRDRCMKKHAGSLRDLKRAEEELKRELSMPKDARNPVVVNSLRDTINSIRASQKTYTDEFGTLSEKQEKIANALRTSRDNRVKRVDDARTSFTGLLKLLEDERERERMGREIDLFNKARKRKEEEMSNYFEFMDGEVDQILVTSDTIKDDENE